jgi:hypothetical protein
MRTITEKIELAQSTAKMLNTNIFVACNASDEIIDVYVCKTQDQAYAKFECRYGDLKCFGYIKQFKN